MNCRDCNRPMRQWAADNWFCEACRLEALQELTGVLWTRHPPAIDPEILDGQEIEIGHHRYRLTRIR